ncbi:Pimeloyl-ACP methyl ester carboxylesterase [Tenacibaculum sp. MAR_2009_124]|uniref:alpha/beta hydrolase n=1 Tax=Tenacibaculum sp. MAR_2009_124 TaxID=1250059 RepID=UPI00089534F5|nr:alpha/beta hydrolase [Tenacibaculum sp. MAR_2009_124]SEB54452.1 Pimeloyl-ACP methyl ester carboxylesterase [Tenacibaculum sp. MAR_2009_124]
MNFTNVRVHQKSIQIPKKVILLAKSLQYISSNYAAKFAAKLFITPVQFPSPKREKMLYKSAQKKIIHIPTIDKSVEILQYGYSKRKVLFVHGWAGRGTQLFLAADKLLENGFMYVSFNGPAHGKSSGKTTSMLEFIETIKEIDKQFGPFEIAIGHSFGGMCLYNSIAAGFSVKKLITIGAADKISGVIEEFIYSLKLKTIVAKKMKRIFDEQWGKDIDIHSSSTIASKIQIPTLVIHDSNDGDVPVSSAIKIRQSLQEGILFITEGLGHTKILRDKKVTSKIINFINS